MARYKIVHHPKQIDANNVFCCNARSINDAKAQAKKAVRGIEILSIQKISD
jgi:hypothetical protein